MIASEREAVILGVLRQRGATSIHTLLEHCPGTSAVTLRRDLGRMQAEGRLRRARGGAPELPSETVVRPVDAPRPRQDPHGFDGLILPPVSGRWAHTLRQQAARRRIPFLAESAPQVGGIYLGPANLREATRLGGHAGREHGASATRAEVLLLALEALPNTRERVEGFAAGFASAFAGEVVFHRVDSLVPAFAGI